MNRRWIALMGAAAVVASSLAVGVVSPAAAGPCDPGGSPIVCENSKPGNPPSEWQVQGSGDDTIQGFATQISTNVGGRVDFKIKTAASAYGIEIFRLGYYGGDGARRIATLSPSATLPQSQPNCVDDPSTNNFDCGNWAVSASWNVPSTAVSGVYIALIGADNVGWSHITFVVRDDSSHSDVIFQTSDTTWQAYNLYGGSDFYDGTRKLSSGPIRAFKVSYNRPFATRNGVTARDFLFSNEYPMIRFLERNGYDVSYQSGLDTDARGSLLLNHKTFLSVGHDEYWSGQQRANVEAARDAGVNLGFFSGNEVYWKTRWEPSIDGTATADRTLVTYKETWDNAKIDPSAEWTGTWRDPRFSPPSDGGRPENALTGTAYMSNHLDLAVQVPAPIGKQRFWKNTSAATLTSGQVTTLAPHSLGYESDEDLDNGFRPAGLIHLSDTTGPTPEYLRDYGNTVTPGTTTHNMTMYKAPSGAKVFSAGTIQWAWGLDANHDGGEGQPADPNMQQFTINVLADLGSRGSTLMSGMAQPAASTDTVAPTTVITSPTAGDSFSNGDAVTVTGTATDQGGGVVAGVEVSVDNGATWHAATGTSSWSYTYIQHGVGPQTIRARATDDSLNTGGDVSVATSSVCPCSLFGNVVPVVPDAGADNAVTLGMKWQSTIDGWVTGVRFYKSVGNTGTHLGSLWGPTGTQLATGTFTGETASGWQTLQFAAPVQVTAGTTYTVGYYAPTGHYALQQVAFSGGDVVAAPLKGMANTAASGNGTFAYGAHQRPTESASGTNYFVDVVFSDRDTFPPVPLTTTPLAGSTSNPTAVAPSATFSEPVDASSLQFTVRDPGGAAVPGVTSYDGASRTATFTPSAPLASSTSYTGAVRATDLAGNVMTSAFRWTFTTAAPDPVPGVCPCGLWTDDTVPAVTSVDEGANLELGVRFQSATAGQINGVRFFKGPRNIGTHTGSLWSTSGSLLATATFTSESTSGWQTVLFATPVSVTAGTTYIVSYSTSVGYYSATWGAFDTQGVTTKPLSAGVSAGAYKYGGGFPSDVSTANYFVDPVFTVGSSLTPTVARVSPGGSATSVPVGSGVTVTFADMVRPGTAQVALTGPSGPVAGTVSTGSDWKTAIFTPSQPLAASTAYTVTVSGAMNLGGYAMPASYATAFTTAGPAACPCTLFSSDAVPGSPTTSDGSAVSLGVKVVPTVDGSITGVRFYKGAGNTGVHTGSLWTASGTRLATLTFTGESDSGWQTGTFSQAVNVTAGTTYVVSYYAPNGHFAVDQDFFTTAWSNAPLSSPAGSTGNGLFTYGADRFPNEDYRSSNYWVDAIFQTTAASDTTPPSVTSTTPLDGATSVPTSVQPTAVLSEPVDASSVAMTLTRVGGASVAGTTTYDAVTRTGTFTPSVVLERGVQYDATITATDVLGNAMATPSSWRFTTAQPSPSPGVCPCSLWDDSALPSTITVNESRDVELGTKFSSDVDGVATAVKFYKGPLNTGPHTVSLWSATGALLGSGVSSNESSEGWQQVDLTTPVPLTAGATYIVSYRTSSNYSASWNYFDTTGVDNAPLHAPVNGGAYVYNGGFPANASTASYWVDVVFARSGAPADTTAPAVSSVAVAPTPSAATVTWTTDESSTSRVDYGTTTDLGSSATGASGTSHSVALSGLAASTTYYYRVTSADASGNSTTDPATGSAPRSFVTAPAPDTTAPTVTAVSAAVAASAATITWTTDEAATSSVGYGTTTSLGATATGASGTAHSVSLTALSPGTYYYRVTSADAAGNSTTDPVVTSAPRTFVIADTTPPTITAVAATGSGTAATVTWTTDESSTSSVAYGTTTSLGTTTTGISGTSHSVSLTGLAPNTRYYFRVTSADAAGNSTTSPATTSAPAAYVPDVAPITKTTVADFSTGSGGYVGDSSGGEVLSVPSLGSEFSGATTPSGFTSTALVSGGATTYSGGQASLSGSRLYTGTYGSGRSFTSAATLGPSHSIGWGSIASGSTAVTASFVTDASGALAARVNNGGATNQTIAIAGTWTGAEHEYRIDWANNAVTFFVDGAQVASSTFSTGLSLRVIASDPSTAAPVLAVDWLRVAPYGSSNTYTSALIDAGATVGWDTLTRDALLPTGTTLTVQVRSGPNTNTGSGAWTAWSTVSPTTNAITRSSRYLQYRLVLTSSGTRFTTAAVRSVQLVFHVL